MRRRHHGPHCGCPVCREQIVYPTKHKKVDTFSESIVEHIHPTHTTVVNHHLIKNQHLYPQSTSYQNTVNSVDMHSPPFQVPSPGQVGGAMSPGYGPGQVGGAMSPGYGPGQVGGAMGHGHCCKPQHGGMQHGHHHGKHHHWNKHC